MAMKKSIVAVGVLAVLGGAWVGTSWYTGKLIESQLDQGIIQVQGELQKYFPTANANLTIAKYQRGIFSSQITYSAEIDMDQPSRDYITINQNVSHGPFPLEKLSLAPKLAYSKTELVNTPSVKSLFDMAADIPPVVVDTLTAYDGTSTVNIAISPLNDATNAFKFSGITIDGSVGLGNDTNTFNLVTTPVSLTESGSAVNIDKMSFEGSLDNTTKAIDSKVNIGDLIIHSVGVGNTQERYMFKDMELTNKLKIGKFDMSVGVVDFKMKSFIKEINNKPELSISDVVIASDVQENDKNINQTLDTTVGNLTIADQNIGSGRLMMKFNQFDGNSLKYINDNSNHIANLLIASTMGGSPEMALRDKTLANQLVTFLAANPSISISPFTWKNTKGESQIDMTLTLQSPGTLPLNDVSEASKLIKLFTSHSRLSVPMITEQARISHIVFDQMTPEQAQIEADVEVKQLIDAGASTQSLILQGDNLVGTFGYADGVIDLNGQKMSVMQFVQHLGLGLNGMPGE